MNAHAKWLREAAEQIRSEGHAGWGNTCEWAADEIDRLTRERDALAKDKARLDWLDAQWRDPIHLEVGARSVLGDGYVRECVLFTPKGDVQGADVRFTIDAQIEQERSEQAREQE